MGSKRRQLLAAAVYGGLPLGGKYIAAQGAGVEFKLFHIARHGSAAMHLPAEQALKLCPKEGSKLRQQGYIRAAHAPLPFGYSLVAYIKHLRQLQLGHALFLPEGLYGKSYLFAVHGLFLLFDTDCIRI